MEFIADLTHLGDMLGYVRTFFQGEKLSSQTVYKIELAAEEAIVNVISYAYEPKEGVEKIEVSCRQIGQNVYEIEVADMGNPFNPVEFDANPDLNIPVCQRKIGGLGIYLMRQLASEIIYDRKGNKNVLKLIFKIPS